MNGLAWALLLGALMALTLKLGLRQGSMGDWLGDFLPLLIAAALALPVLMNTPRPGHGLNRLLRRIPRGDLLVVLSPFLPLWLGLALAGAPLVGLGGALIEPLLSRCWQSMSTSGSRLDSASPRSRVCVGWAC